MSKRAKNSTEKEIFYTEAFVKQYGRWIAEKIFNSDHDCMTVGCWHEEYAKCDDQLLSDFIEQLPGDSIIRNCTFRPKTTIVDRVEKADLAVEELERVLEESDE